MWSARAVRRRILSQVSGSTPAISGDGLKVRLEYLRRHCAVHTTSLARPGSRHPARAAPWPRFPRPSATTFSPSSRPKEALARTTLRAIAVGNRRRATNAWSIFISLNGVQYQRQQAGVAGAEVVHRQIDPADAQAGQDFHGAGGVRDAVGFGDFQLPARPGGTPVLPQLLLDPIGSARVVQQQRRNVDRNPAIGPLRHASPRKQAAPDPGSVSVNAADHAALLSDPNKSRGRDPSAVRHATQRARASAPTTTPVVQRDLAVGTRP